MSLRDGKRKWLKAGIEVLGKHAIDLFRNQRSLNTPELAASTRLENRSAHVQVDKLGLGP